MVRSWAPRLGEVPNRLKRYVNNAKRQYGDQLKWPSVLTYPIAGYQIALIGAAGQQSCQFFRRVGISDRRFRQLNADPTDQV